MNHPLPLVAIGTAGTLSASHIASWASQYYREKHACQAGCRDYCEALQRPWDKIGQKIEKLEILVDAGCSAGDRQAAGAEVVSYDGVSARVALGLAIVVFVAGIYFRYRISRGLQVCVPSQDQPPVDRTIEEAPRVSPQLRAENLLSLEDYSFGYPNSDTSPDTEVPVYVPRRRR